MLRFLLKATGFMSKKSRNYTLGKLIGEKVGEKQISEYMNNTTIEGLTALRSIHNIINDNKIDIPIIKLIYDIVYNNKNPEDILSFLTN